MTALRFYAERWQDFVFQSICMTCQRAPLTGAAQLLRYHSLRYLLWCTGSQPYFHYTEIAMGPSRVWPWVITKAVYSEGYSTACVVGLSPSFPHWRQATSILLSLCVTPPLIALNVVSFPGIGREGGDRTTQPRRAFCPVCNDCQQDTESAKRMDLGLEHGNEITVLISIVTTDYPGIFRPSCHSRETGTIIL